MPKFDAVVIGAGNGGLAAACRLAKAGKKTLLVEQHNLPEKTDGRREADKAFGYIHPCSTFPLSDVVVEVPGQYQHR